MPTYLFRCRHCKRELKRELRDRKRASHYQSYCDSAGRTVDLDLISVVRKARV